MTMLDETEVRKVFRAELNGVSGIPAAAFRAWENRGFKPPDPDDGQLWIEEFLEIISERKTSSGCIEAVGTTTYSVWVPSRSGTEDGDALARGIAEAFEAGQSLTSSGVTAILERTERAPYRGSDDFPLWVFKSVTTRWRVFTSATA